MSVSMQMSRTLARQLAPWKHIQRPSASLVKRSIAYQTSRQFLSPNTPPYPYISRCQKAPRQFQRHFNSSDVLRSAESFSDPSRPDLFYHVVQPPTPVSKTLPAYALSFSSEKPPSQSSVTIIGWLPAQGQVDPKIAGAEDATLEDFVDNPGFIDLLHSAIKDGLREGVDEIQKAGAVQTMDGWMHIHDQRNIPALNRIGNPDDIIGTVLVENSEILPETYQPMPAYRLVTADGLMQLTPGLAKKLQDLLIRIADAERAALR